MFKGLLYSIPVQYILTLAISVHSFIISCMPACSLLSKSNDWLIFGIYSFSTKVCREDIGGAAFSVPAMGSVG